MTKQEYTEYQESFKNGSKGFAAWSSGFYLDCQDCYNNEHNILNEGHFSSQACEICGSRLGGDRFAAHALDDNNEIIHFEICTDCVYYMEYGQLDDMTMLGVEEG